MTGAHARAIGAHGPVSALAGVIDRGEQRS